MTEHERILSTIEKHKSLFDNTDCDVAITAKGIYFFYYYSKNYDDYYGFVRFQTAEELEKIIMKNISTDFCIGIETAAETLTEAINDLNHRSNDSEKDLSVHYGFAEKKLLTLFSALNKALTLAYEEIHPYNQWIKERTVDSELKL